MMHLLRDALSALIKDEEDKISLEQQKLVRSIGKKGKCRCQLNNPGGVCITKAGDIVVADTDNHRIQIFSSDGNFRFMFGSRGCKPDQINFPICVAMTPEGHVALTDSVNASVKIFSLCGQLLQISDGGGIFDIPHGLAVSQEGEMVVTDVAKHSLTVMTKEGEVIHSFGEYGTDHYEFDHPYYVCLDHEKHICVSDSGNCCIKIFSFEGRGLRTFKQDDFKLVNENFVTLQGITCDSEGNVLIICNTTVYLLARNGRLWEIVTQKDGLVGPKCIAVSPQSRVLVTQADPDSRQHEVCVFKYNPEDYRSVNSVQYYAINV